MFASLHHAIGLSDDLPRSDVFRSIPLVSLDEVRRAKVLHALAKRPPLPELAEAMPFGAEIQHVIEKTCGGRWQIGARTARVLALAFNDILPTRILEFGSGASTVIFAALAKWSGIGAHVVSIDENPQYAARTRLLLNEHRLLDFATVIVAPVTRRSIDGWRGYVYQLDADRLNDALRGSFAELVFVDGPASWMKSRADCRFGTLLTARSWLSDGAVFVADDVFRTREEAILRRWDQVSGFHVHGIVPVGRGLGVGTVSTPDDSVFKVTTRQDRYVAAIPLPEKAAE